MAGLCHTRWRILKKYGHDGNYNWYFSLNREGKPLVEPYNIFSYTFATMAFGQLSLATGCEEYADIAKRHSILFFPKQITRKENGINSTPVHET